MAEVLKVSAQSRQESGSGAAKRFRRGGLLPCVINDTKGQARSLLTAKKDFEILLRSQVSENLLIDLAVDGAAPVKVLLREVQHSPLTGDVMHVDFVEISMTRKMRVEIPVRLVGSAAGVALGGVLEQMLRAVHAECLPGDLVDTIDADISALQIGDSLMVSHLTIPPKIAVLTAGDVAIAHVAAPRLEEEKPAEEAEAAPAEPELVGAKKKEEGEEGGEEAEAAPEGKKEAKKEKG